MLSLPRLGGGRYPALRALLLFTALFGLGTLLFLCLVGRPSPTPEVSLSSPSLAPEDETLLPKLAGPGEAPWLDDAEASDISAEDEESQLIPQASDGSVFDELDSPVRARLPPICAPPDPNPAGKRENATILILAQNNRAKALAETLDNFEAKFNAAYRYPYTILSDVPFSEPFRQAVAGTLPDGALVEYGLIPTEHWGIPEWLDQDNVRKGFVKLAKEGVMHGGKESYHNMCRYFSGFFAMHPLLAKYRYYWRLEPQVKFYCQTTYDPFRFMRENDKIYGFNIALFELGNTIPSLFRTALDWRDSGPVRDISRKTGQLWDLFLKDSSGQTNGGLRAKEEYSGCHFWTNFELGDLDFFRSKDYQSFFRHLDKTGGFYYERWGDAAVRSLALGLLARTDQAHYFEDIAYMHYPYLHYPEDEGLRCNCDAAPQSMLQSNYHNIAKWEGETCMRRWKELQDRS